MPPARRRVFRPAFFLGFPTAPTRYLPLGAFSGGSELQLAPNEFSRRTPTSCRYRPGLQPGTRSVPEEAFPLSNFSYLATALSLGGRSFSSDIAVPQELGLQPLRTLSSRHCRPTPPPPPYDRTTSPPRPHPPRYRTPYTAWSLPSGYRPCPSGSPASIRPRPCARW